jgi:dGTPase
MHTIYTNTWQKNYDTLLAPYAVKHTYGLGRVDPDTEYLDRFRFEVDTNRVRFLVHAFKKMQGKQQVFRAGTDERVQTRITHSERVAALSSSVCRMLGLNPELGYAIGITHDIGHTPFGHAGQDALNECMQQYGKRFEHNLQSHWIVTTLEPQNLNQEVLDGLLKHTTPEAQNTNEPILERGHSLEAQITNLADAITYSAHDLQDGITMGILDETLIATTKLGSLVTKHPKGMWRGIIQLLTEDIHNTFAPALAAANIQTLKDVYSQTSTLALLSSTMRTMLQEFNAFMYKELYMHPLVLGQSTEGAACIHTLFSHLYNTPNANVAAYQNTHNYAREDAVKDYLAQLTDQEALRLQEGL